MLSSFHHPSSGTHKGRILNPGSESCRTSFVNWGKFPALSEPQSSAKWELIQGRHD